MRILLSYARELTVACADSARPDDTGTHDEQRFENVSLAFMCVEERDAEADAAEMANYTRSHRSKHGSESVLLMPFAHLSPHASCDLTHVDRMQYLFAEFLRESDIPFALRPPDGQDVLFARWLLFDGNASSHLRCSENALRLEIKALERVFGRSALERLLSKDS